MKRVSAVFSGPEPSLGYVPGERYELVVDRHWVRDVAGVGRPCPYQNVETLDPSMVVRILLLEAEYLMAEANARQVVLSPNIARDLSPLGR